MLCFLSLIVFLYSCKEDRLENYTNKDMYRFYESQKDDSLKLILNYFVKKDCVEALYFKGLFFSSCDLSDSVIYYLERVKIKYPEDFLTNCVLSEFYFLEKKYDESLKCLNTVQDIYNTDKGDIQHFFYHHIGRDMQHLHIIRLYTLNLVKMNKKEEALKYLSSGLKLGDDYIGLYRDSYKLKLNLGDTVGANKDKAVYEKKFPKKDEDRKIYFMSQGKRGYDAIFCK